MRSLAPPLLLTVVFLTSHFAQAHGGLSLGLRIQQEFYKPLIPVARNFKTCFKTDPRTGVQIMSFCTELQKADPHLLTPIRVPAGTSTTGTPPAVPRTLHPKVYKK